MSTQDLLSSQHVAEEENGESEAAEEDEEEEGGESEKAEEDEEQEGGESEEEEEEGAQSEEEEEKEPARVELVGMAPKDAKPVLVPDTENKKCEGDVPRRHEARVADESRKWRNDCCGSAVRQGNGHANPQHLVGGDRQEEASSSSSVEGRSR